MEKRKYFNARCRVCGKEFYVRPYFSRQGWGKYCSRRCKDESQKTGKFVICSYCGKQVYKALANLRRESKTKTYFCNKSCQCAWKNKRRRGRGKSKSLKHLWRSWCNSSIRVCGTLGEGAHPSGLPTFFLRFEKKKDNPLILKRPSKKVLYSLYWKKNYTQNEIARIFNATHTSVKRWFIYHKIPVKPRTLSCGRNPNTLKNLELGNTEEAYRKSAESRTIYSREKLIEKIKEFARKERRIPTKNEFAKNPLYPDPLTFRDYFGTWNNAIKAAGYKPNEQWFSSSKNLYAKDGHLCNSVSEIIIDDWLSKNNIPHTREKPYPEGGYLCDFVINDVFVEFFGLADASNIAPKYSIIMENKRKLCKRYNIPLIALYDKDLHNLDQALGEGLEKIKRKKSILTSLLFKLQTRLF